MVQFPMRGLRLHLFAFLIGSIGLVALYSLRHQDFKKLLDTSLIPIYLFVAFYLTFFIISFSKSRRLIRTFLIIGQVFWWSEVWSVILSANFNKSWSPFGAVQYMSPIWDEIVRQCSENGDDSSKTVFGKQMGDCGKLEVGLTMYMIMGEIGWRAANIFLLGGLSLYYYSLAPAKPADLESGTQPVVTPPVEKVDEKVEQGTPDETEADKDISEHVALLSRGE